MDRLLLLAAQIAGKVAEAEGILKAESPSTEDVTKANALLAEAAALKAQHDALMSARAAQASLKAWVETPATSPPAPEPAPEPNVPGATMDLKSLKVPDRGRAPVRAFDDDDTGDRWQKAHAFGMWAKAALNRGQGQAANWCKDHGLPFMIEASDAKAMTESINTAGGYLVPDVFLPDLIRIVEQYGVARAIARMQPMARDTVLFPRRTGGLTGYYVGEGTAPTATDVAVDNVQLVAKKLATLTYHSSELGEDSVVDIGNLLALEIGQAFAYQEDLAMFQGDGTSTYGGMIGIPRAFRDSVEGAGGTWTTDAHRLYNPGLNNLTGNLISEATLADFHAAPGQLVGSVNDANCVWIASRVFFYGVMQRLALAAGGTQASEIINGVRRPMFLGFPVMLAQTMPTADGASVLQVLFGDFKQAVRFGDRRQMTIATSDQFLFSTDQIAIRGTERFHIVVHDVGTANSTAASRVRGPIGGLCALNA
jgi:HK97 family phage major capsid protein